MVDESCVSNVGLFLRRPFEDGLDGLRVREELHEQVAEGLVVEERPQLDLVEAVERFSDEVADLFDSGLT